MEFTLQSFEILSIGLIVMGLFLAVIPVGHGDTRLRGYRISLKVLALSFVCLSTYCLLKAKMPRELLYVPFFVSSHIQVCLLGLAHLNLLNLNIVHKKMVLLNFCPLFSCVAVFALVQQFFPFVNLTSWEILFNSLSNPSVIVRILWLLVYISQILYYAVIFFREERTYYRELGNFLSEKPNAKYRLALFSFIGALLAGADSICICLTLNKFWGGVFNLIMLLIYAAMCLCFIKYPAIFFRVSSVISDTPEERTELQPTTPWSSLKQKIREDKLYLAEGLTIDQLANMLNINKRVLSYMINTMEGANFNTFIGRLRTSEAQEIMKKHTDLSLSEIAFKVGYSEQSNFSRQFKSVTGFTPGDYRKKLQTND